MVCHRAMNELPRHPFTICIVNGEYVKGTFYCEECNRVYPIGYMNQHHRTYKHLRNLLIQENVPRIHPSEVNDILNE